jgi:hypothetical protein
METNTTVPYTFSVDGIIGLSTINGSVHADKVLIVVLNEISSL